MFWESVWHGLTIFSHWEVWAVVVAYMVTMFVISLTGATLLARDRTVLGMTWMFLLAPLLQVLAVLVVIMSLWPILFSLGDSASWGLPWYVLTERTWPTVKLVLGILAVVIVFGAIGLTRIGGVTEFLIGALATASIASLMANISPNLKATDLELWPGFLVAIGFLILAVIVQVLVLLLLTAVSTLLKIDPEENEGASMLLVAPITGAIMFLPTFMYASFLAPQLARF